MRHRQIWKLIGEGGVFMAMRNANVAIIVARILSPFHVIQFHDIHQKEHEPSSSSSRFRVVVASSLSGDVVPCHCRPGLALCLSNDDEEPIGRCSSFGCHVAMGDVAPGLCV